MNRFLSLILTFCLALVAHAQLKQFSFNMIKPTAFAVLNVNNPSLRSSANGKSKRVSISRMYKGEMLPICGQNGQWQCLEVNSRKGRNVQGWVPKSQVRVLRVAQQQQCVMPPAYRVEGANGMIGAAIEGPDAQFVTRSEGIYGMLPFSVAHPSGSDNYTLQFLMAGTDPSYTYVVTTSFVVTRVNGTKMSLDFARDVEDGEIVYEMLYFNMPRAIADEEVEAKVLDFLQNCPDSEFENVIDAAFTIDGGVNNVVVYFKGTDGKRYSYAYDGNVKTKCPAQTFHWEFK